MQLKIYSDCFGKAGGKIFPQSVRLDDIKSLWYRETRARARQDAFSFLDMPGQRVFFLVSGILAASVLHVVVPVTGGESHFFPSSSCFSGHWHAARQYVASQCELPCPAGWQREKRHTHTHVQIKLAAACRLKPNCCTCVIFCWLR